jgi:hypothetical protein
MQAMSCTDDWIAFAVAGGALPERALRLVDASKEIRRISAVLSEVMKSAPEV